MNDNHGLINFSGLKSEDGEQFLDSILRCRFTEYPKMLVVCCNPNPILRFSIDSPIKFVYFLLFHLSIGTDISYAIEEIMLVHEIDFLH